MCRYFVVEEYKKFALKFNWKNANEKLNKHLKQCRYMTTWVIWDFLQNPIFNSVNGLQKNVANVYGFFVFSSEFKSKADMPF